MPGHLSRISWLFAAMLISGCASTTLRADAPIAVPDVESWTKDCGEREPLSFFVLRFCKNPDGSGELGVIGYHRTRGREILIGKAWGIYQDHGGGLMPVNLSRIRVLLILEDGREFLGALGARPEMSAIEDAHGNQIGIKLRLKGANGAYAERVIMADPEEAALILASAQEGDFGRLPQVESWSRCEIRRPHPFFEIAYCENPDWSGEIGARAYHLTPNGRVFLGKAWGMQKKWGGLLGLGYKNIRAVMILPDGSVFFGARGAKPEFIPITDGDLTIGLRIRLKGANGAYAERVIMKDGISEGDSH